MTTQATITPILTETNWNGEMVERLADYLAPMTVRTAIR
jgi:hypothetical protein